MKTCFALSLLSASCLIAETTEANSKNPNPPKENYSFRNDCCSPCCVPRPKQCINCVCYTPPFYEYNGCDWGTYLTADFLYWYAKETNLAYAAKEVAVNINDSVLFSPTVVSASKIKHFGTKWSPGFRVGIGMQTECDGWDYYVNYTWFRNEKKDSVSVPTFGSTSTSSILFFTPLVGQSFIINPWINLAIQAQNHPAVFDSVAAKWSLRLNDIDFELGYQFWLSKSFTLRPYAALRAVWTHRNFTTFSFYNQPTLTTVTLDFKDSFKDRYWGVGMMVGFKPEWYFTKQFALISNFDAALLWGRLSDKKRSDYFGTGALLIPIDYHAQCRNDFAKMQSIIDLMVGFRWDETWACERFRTALDIGWEQHIWLNFTDMIKYNTTSFGGSLVNFQAFNQQFEEFIGDLQFGGLTVHLRFDF